MVDKNLNWEKFWSFKFSLLGASILGDYYPIKMSNQMGKTFKNVIMVSRKGHTSCYLVKEQRKEYGLYQISNHVKEGDISEFCKLLKEKTDEILSVIEILNEKEITQKEIEVFINLVQEYTGYYTVPRQVIDFIQPDLVNQLIEGLKDVRLYAEPVFSLIDKTTCRIAEQISKKTNYNPDILTCLLMEELITYLETEKLPDKQELEKRYQGSGIIFDEKGHNLTTNKEEVEELEKIHLKETKDEVKGTVTHKGKARGIARIVHNPFKVKEFNQGDILITGMTRPDYLPLMKKSAAIVTDVGGLLCHAAIVSREIGKPCIIGTQIATKTFKDGDLVEVDAEKGIIKRVMEE